MFDISIFVPTPSVLETITGFFIRNLERSNIEPKLPIFLKDVDSVFFLYVFFDILDMYCTNLSAAAILTPLFL